MYRVSALIDEQHDKIVEEEQSIACTDRDEQVMACNNAM
jgi:hypothetical protein